MYREGASERGICEQRRRERCGEEKRDEDKPGGGEREKAQQ